MKINEKILFDHDNDKIVVKRTFDLNAELKRVQMINSSGIGQSGHNKLVGSIPINLIADWCKESGVKWSDVEARKDVVKKKILSGETYRSGCS